MYVNKVHGDENTSKIGKKYEKVENVENLNDWSKVLQSWSENYLAKGKDNLLEEAIPEFERTIIKVALNKTMGRKKEAAELLGWGRNTLTRKIKELGIET